LLFPNKSILILLPNKSVLVKSAVDKTLSFVNDDRFNEAPIENEEILYQSNK